MRFLSLVALLILVFASCENTQQEKTKIKPNIVYILADDLGYGDLSCYGQTRFQTPNIDRLAKQGMLFTQHYSGSTVCAPSRSSLLTGLHTGHTPIRGNKEIQPEGQYPLADSLTTFPEILQDNGYITGVFGKWGLGFPGSEGDPLNQGFDTFYGYNCQRLAHNYFPGHLWNNDQKVILHENDSNNLSSYAPKLIHDKALTFLEENKDTTFFLYYASALPHAELLVPEEEMAPFRDKYLPEKLYEGAVYGDPLYREGKYGSQEESHAAFAAMVSILDRQVGELIAKLNELGLSENTLVIFTSDNGPHQEGGADPDYFDSNGSLRGYKRDLYEGGVRVPMIASWQGKISEGTKSDHISAFWDVLPTVTDLLDVENQSAYDGISFLPTLLGNPQEEHEYLYWEFGERNPSYRAIRKDNWKAVKFSGKPIELYDLDEDIEEQNNLADSNPEKAEELLGLIQSARSENSHFPL